MKKPEKRSFTNIKEAQMTNSKELLKKLNNEIWEFRTLFKKTYYRLFAFWDKTDRSTTLVLTTHGLVKKTGKTSKGEIEHAERIRKMYFENK